MRDVSVRDFRLRFTGADRLKEPVQVMAYGRLVGTWYPAGTLPTAKASGTAARGDNVDRRPDPDLPRLSKGAHGERPTPSQAPRPSLADRQRARDEWLRKVNSPALDDD